MQFQGLMMVFYDFQGARLAHFLAMAAIALFILVHVSLAILVPRTIKAMITGRVRVKVKPIGVMPAAGE